MCQTSVYVEKDGVEELRFSDVTNLSVDGSGVKISTLFEGETELHDTVLHSIDFMAGKVLLHQSA